MATIKKETSITSVALMTGVESKVNIFPSDKKGIRFFIGGAEVEAKVENVVSTEHCTVLGTAGAKVMLIEHFMAACAFTRIDSLDVCLEHFELPILDGSSKRWVELFTEAGVVPAEKETYKLKEPVCYQNGKTHLVMVPSDEFYLTYGVNFDNVELKNKWYDFGYDFGCEKGIIEARTFGYLKELEALQAAGFARGVTIENTVGLTPDGFTVPLRSELEPIKHKMLDLIGDFYLTGVNPFDIKARIIAKEAGHAVHVKTATIFKDKLIKEHINV